MNENTCTASAASASYMRIIGGLIKEYTDEGDIVYDPLSGSGTHLYVAKKLNRRPIGVDIDPQYKNTELNVQVGDSSKTKLPSNKFDMVITSCNPWKNTTSDSKEAAENLPTEKEYKRMIDAIAKDASRTLSKGRYFVNIAADDSEFIRFLTSVLGRYMKFIGVKKIVCSEPVVNYSKPNILCVMLFRKESK